MTNLHIHTQGLQPATGWIDTHGPEPMQSGFSPEDLLYPDCCNKPRLAKDCVVQCYYDGLKVWCGEDKGCKDPAVIAAKKLREFNNRSAGQKARFSKAKSGTKSA
jgi:hypothetical protein